MAKVKLKNGFENYSIQIVCDYFPVLPVVGEIELSSDEYKSISIKKLNGDWPGKMMISWNKDDFDFIFLENIEHQRCTSNKRIYFWFKEPPPIAKEIDDFEIQIKIKQLNNRGQNIQTNNDPDTTVTIGDAQPGSPPNEKKKKG